MISEMFSANGGRPKIGEELRARFYEAELVDVKANRAFESWGSPAGIATFTDFIVQWVGPSWAEAAIADRIAIREEFEEWREAALVWKDQLGAFVGWSSGEAVGRKR